MSKIIIGNGLSQDSELSLRVGLTVANKLKKHAKVIHSDELADFATLDNVFAHLNLEVQDHYAQSIIEANNEVLKKQIDGIGLGVENVEYASKAGRADDVLVCESEDEDVDLLVLGHNKNKNWAEKFLGGITEGIVHRSHKSVLIVKDDLALNPKRILVAYDFSYHCEEALKWAQVLAKAYSAEIHLLNVVPCYYEGYHLAHTIHNEFSDFMEKMINENLESIKDKLETVRAQIPADIKSYIYAELDKEGSISEKISQFSEDYEMDLIITGSHKRGRVAEVILGSIASKLIKKAPRSVLIAK